MLLARADYRPAVTRSTLEDSQVDEAILLGGLPTMSMSTQSYSTCR